MSGTILTPSNARKPDSASGYQYLVEKMRLAAEWRDNTFIPNYQQGDAVFYQGNMYIKKNAAANSLVNPASNTSDWISLSDYIYKEAGNNLGEINYDNAGVNYKNYLNTLTDEEKINPKVFNAAVAAYNILLDKGITRGGNYSFTTRTKTGGAPNSFYAVHFFCESPYYMQAWAINNEYRGGGAPNDLSRPYFYTSTQGFAGSYTPVNAIEQLGYTPAKVGDSWISFRAYYNSGNWRLSADNTFRSGPDLAAFDIELDTGFPPVPDFFAFRLKKNGTNAKYAILTDFYNVSVTPFIAGGAGTIGPSAFYLKPSSIQGVTYGIYNANVYLVLGSSSAVTYQTAFAPYHFNITVYFSKNI